jgi:hypothetical protein
VVLSGSIEASSRLAATNRKRFSARGALGKFIVVVPDKDIVVAFANHTEYPDADKQRGMSDAELRNLPSVSAQQMASS